jgi:hypothetical protein
MHANEATITRFFWQFRKKATELFQKTDLIFQALLWSIRKSVLYGFFELLDVDLKWRKFFVFCLGKHFRLNFFIEFEQFVVF